MHATRSQRAAATAMDGDDRGAYSQMSSVPGMITVPMHQAKAAATATLTPLDSVPLNFLSTLPLMLYQQQQAQLTQALAAQQAAAHSQFASAAALAQHSPHSALHSLADKDRMA